MLENSEKLVPVPSYVAPNGYGCPAHIWRADANGRGELERIIPEILPGFETVWSVQT